MSQDASQQVVLVVDDNPVIRALIRRILENAAYTVLEAEDGEQAAELLDTTSVDLLITDLVMPGKEGLELIRLCRRAFPQLKIIAVSGAFQGNFLRAAELLGADAIIYKPFEPEELLRAVDRVLAHG